MKYQILFSGKNKKNITILTSAGLAQGLVKVNSSNIPYLSLNTRTEKSE